MITGTFRINLGQLCARVRRCVHVFDFVMIEQNISNDSHKDVQICISPTFIEPCVNQGIKVWLCINAGCMQATLTGELLAGSTEGKRKYRRQTY